MAQIKGRSVEKPILAKCTTDGLQEKVIPRLPGKRKTPKKID